MELSYCVVNTNGRDDLLSCLEAIARTHPGDIAHEVLVLDNASDDGSIEAVRAAFPDVRLIARDRRAGIAANLNLLLRESRGRFCLSLNEDSIVTDGAAQALLEALRSDDRAGAAGAMLVTEDGSETACAWRLPGLGSALAGALFLHRLLVTQSGGGQTREVGWVRSAALMIRREAAEQVGWFDADFFFYGEEADFQKRLHDSGWHVLHVPAARVVHNESDDEVRKPSPRRLVQFHRGRDLYMRKHHAYPVVVLSRVLSAWSYAVRAVAALILPGHSPGAYWRHARQALRPRRGEGMAELAEAYNRRLASDEAAAPTSPRGRSHAGPARRPRA